jgi:hypothetical protein
MTPRTPLSYVPKYPTGVRGCETPALVPSETLQ